MFHRFVKISLAAVIAAGLIISQCGCAQQQKEEFSRGEDWLLNTYCYISIYEAGREDLIKEAFALAREKENLFSRTIAGSDIGRFNASGEGCEVSSETADMVTLALEYGRLTDGLFDVGIGALTALWDFSAEQPVKPSDEAIEEALVHVGKPEGISVERRADGSCFMSKDDPLIKLDLGAVAKGAIGDALKDFLAERGVSAAVINLGGNVVLLGAKPSGGEWIVGIEDPAQGGNAAVQEERSILGRVKLAEGSVVTSGTYERCFAEGSRVYHHVLDPRSGYPVDTDLVSATIIGPSSRLCDVISTCCLLLGKDRALEFMKSREAYEAVFVDTEGNIITTPGVDFTETLKE